MPIPWIGEGFDYPVDPETGVRVTRMTTTLKHHVNVYCEHSYSSPDGKRIAILRSPNADPRLPPFDLLVGDIEKLKLSVIEQDVASIVVATASWTGWIYYITNRNELMRVNMMTLEKEVLFTHWPFSPDFILHTVSPDLRYLVGQLAQASYDTALVRIDVVEKTWKIIFEHPEISNAHPLYNPINGEDIAMLVIRGTKVNHWNDYLPVETPHPGPTHWVVNKNGGNLRKLPWGEPRSPNPTGHSQWIGDTGLYATTLTWNYDTWELDPRFPGGNLLIAKPGEKEIKVFPCSEHRFNHIATSKCGRYFVCDSYWKRIPGPIPLVVGNFQTGKSRMLLTDCKAQGGASACSHPHAYFTADNRNVIYNADPFMVGHVWAARVPESFLRSLD